MLDQDLIADCIRANPYFMEELFDNISIMPMRKDKYSGQVDPYTNFKLLFFKLRLIEPISMHLLFMFYGGLKDARLLVASGDFSDDSMRDSLRDHSNYLVLYKGALNQREYERKRADSLGLLAKDVPWTWDWIDNCTEAFTNRGNFYDAYEGSEI